MRPKVYLDTTVPSAYFDDRTPDRQRLTRQFWTERLCDFDPAISTVVLLEIRDTPDSERRQGMERLVDGMRVLPFGDEADELAQEYVKRGVFPEKYTADANHVAIAVVNGIGYFASWNFAHLVKVNTRRQVNLVNALVGRGPIEIVAPPEL
jgi:hypothetical protein